MFTYKKPEEKGIKSENIKKYVEILEKAGLSTHNVVIARGNDIVYENYWAPFHKDFLHRQYSVSKSFVGIAVGFLIQDGKLNLDDKIVDFYDEAYIEGCGEMVCEVGTVYGALESGGVCCKDCAEERKPETIQNRKGE